MGGGLIQVTKTHKRHAYTLTLEHAYTLSSAGSAQGTGCASIRWGRHKRRGACCGKGVRAGSFYPFLPTPIIPRPLSLTHSHTPSCVSLACARMHACACMCACTERTPARACAFASHSLSLLFPVSLARARACMCVLHVMYFPACNVLSRTFLRETSCARSLSLSERAVCVPARERERVCASSLSGFRV